MKYGSLLPFTPRTDEGTVTSRFRNPVVEAAPALELEELGRLARNPAIGDAVAAVRDLLGMEVAFTTRFTDELQVLDRVTGDGGSFGLREGLEMSFDDAYCRQILDGELPSMIPDVRSHPLARELPITASAQIGAFLSVPVRLADGSVHGTLCCASHRAHPELGERDLDFMHVLARVIAGQVEREQLERLTHELELRGSASTVLAKAIAARDTYTGDHSRAVVGLAERVGRKLGADDEGLEEIRLVALLHDTGKLAVPDVILRKPGPLNDDEWEVMRMHPARGAEIAASTPAISHLASAIRAEHERWDGSGYPDGLAGEEIPLASRVTLVCDAYHAMRTDRPYRAALSEQRARAEIERHAGTQFCPTAARTLLEVLDEEHTARRRGGA